MSNQVAAGWGFRPRTSLGQRGQSYTEEDHATARALYGRIIDIYSSTRIASGPSRPERIAHFPKAAIQHFQGFLLGEQGLDHLLASVSKLGEWAGFPPALRAAFVGMCAESALSAPPRKRSATKRASHLMFSGGALVESLMFDEAGAQVRSQAEAIAMALPMLQEMGMADSSVDSDQLRDWHARLRKREGLGPLRRGRPARK